MQKKTYSRMLLFILLFTFGFTAKALNPPTNEIVDVSNIKIDKTSAIINNGGSISLNATIEPSNASNKSVIWTSSNENIATVTNNGFVRGRSIGTTTITATSAANDNITASCEITVASIEFDITSRGLKEGESFTISPIIKPENISNEIIWKSSKETIATVNDGLVTGVKAGTTSISASIKGDEAISATCNVIVSSKDIPLTGISFSNLEIQVYTGETIRIPFTISPSDATDINLNWSSSDKSIAIVDNGNVTGISQGKVIITAVSESNPDIHNSINITVLQTIPVDGLSGVPDELTLKERSGAHGLNVKVSPEDATNKEITAQSSNVKVARVVKDPSGNGIFNIIPVAANKNGTDATADITFTSVSNPDITATCRVTVEFVPILATSVKLNKSSLKLVEGDDAELIATIIPEDATNKTLEWTTSNSDIATVDGNGKVTAVSEGVAVIKASTTDGSKDAEGNPLCAVCSVTVSKKVIPVTKLVMSETEKTVKLNGTIQLSVTYEPENTTQKDVKWTSSNKYVATVDENGLVTAIKGGTATITATSVNKSTVKATCKVTVTVPVTELEIVPDYIAVKVGKTQILKTSITPSDATTKKLSWTSNDEAIATVDENGIVKGIAPGKTTVVASTTDGSGITASAEVLVKAADEIDITRISIDPSSKTIYQYNTLELKATITPADATHKDIKWESSNPEIATVDENGLVTALNGGDVTITATSVYTPSVSGKATIKITPILRKIETISLVAPSEPLLIGDEYTIAANIWPTSATNKNLTWTSSDPDIATVSQSGKVVALAEGEVTITATAQDESGVSATCSVKVQKPEEITENKIVLSETEVYLEESETFTLEAKVYLLTSGVSKELIWSSDNEKVATVRNGVISARSIGSAIITAALKEHPEIFATCTVDVSEHVIYISSIRLYNTAITLTEGETYNLNYSYSPSNATKPSFHWITDNSNVATVIDGKVTAVGEGEATITVMAMDGSGCESTCKVTVKASTGINGTSMDDIKITINGNEIIISGAEEAVKDIYSIDGRLIYHGVEDKIDTLAPGIYVIKVAYMTRKFVIK